jgi:hypothetical protein
MLEFLLAMPAVLGFWTEVGGAGHMDFVPWYTKFTLTLGASVAIVYSTAAAVESERAWNAKSIAWALVVLLLAAGMAAATYYVHVHEPDDPDAPAAPIAQGPGSVAGLRIPALKRVSRP